MNITQQTAETGGAMVAKAAPPLAVVGANIAGWSVPEWVQLLTLIYVILMVAHKLWTMGVEAYKFWVKGER